MNDYKELIDWLRRLAKSNKRFVLSAEDYTQVAEAIEQLMKENYEWCLSYSDHCAESQKEIKRLTKERDAAVTWVPHQCGTCKHHHVHGLAPIECDKNGCTNFFKPENWEWGGVQDETD